MWDLLLYEGIHNHWDFESTKAAQNVKSQLIGSYLITICEGVWEKLNKLLPQRIILTLEWFLTIFFVCVLLVSGKFSKSVNQKIKNAWKSQKCIRLRKMCR